MSALNKPSICDTSVVKGVCRIHFFLLYLAVCSKLFEVSALQSFSEIGSLVPDYVNLEFYFSSVDMGGSSLFLHL